ncbi:MAG: polymer-forming cytoskeletal protein [Candidatus Aminicenantes bacterium]|nr:polymer-forming cytoskeletal protein [Candidatus Aminicenantes bacterium]
MAFKAVKKEDKGEKYSTGYSDSAPGQVESGSFIGETMKIKGDFISDEDVIIEGNVTGNIKISKTLTIGKKGEVTADIDANKVRIIGFAKGSINASNKVEILPQGRYYGNLKSKVLVVEEGAILIGEVNKEKEGEKKKE